MEAIVTEQSEMQHSSEGIIIHNTTHFSDPGEEQI